MIFYVGNKLASHGASLTGIETLSAQLEGIGIKVISVSDKKNIVLRLVDMVISLLSHKRKIDVVLIDTYSKKGFWYAVIIGFLCRRLRIPYVPILRGGGLPLRLPKSPQLSRVLFSGSAMNVAPSKGFVDLFRKNGYKVICIPNNINLAEYTFKERSVFKMNLLWVRSFHSIYNPGLAIRLLHELLKMGYDAKLCMVGPDKDGSLDNCKELANKLNVQDKVVFTGMLSKSKWHKLAADYDIFINTTNFDNTPVSVIEAMALGLPVVSTNVGGIPYLLSNKEDALLVSPDNLDEFLAAVIETKEEVEQTGKRILAARKKVEDFDWEVVKDKWIELFKPYSHA